MFLKVHFICVPYRQHIQVSGEMNGEISRSCLWPNISKSQVFKQNLLLFCAFPSLKITGVSIEWEKED